MRGFRHSRVFYLLLAMKSCSTYSSRWAMWHGLAKLRMHTDDMLTLFEDTTTTLAAALRRFKRTTCEVHYTRENDTKSLGGKKSKGQRLGAKPVAAPSRSLSRKGKGKEITSRGTSSASKRHEKERVGLRDGKSAQDSALSFRFSEVRDNRLDIYSDGNLFTPASFFLLRPDLILFLSLLLGGIAASCDCKRNWARTNKNNTLTQMTNLERRWSILRRDAYRQVPIVGKGKRKRAIEGEI